MKPLYIGLFLLCLSFNSFGQKKSARWYKEATVELNNGSILKGKLLESSDDIIKIEILGGSIFVYPRSEVKSVHLSDEKVYSIVKQYQYNREGMYYAFLLNTNFSVADAGIGGEVIVGKQYNNYLAGGVGMGYNQISINDGVASIPLFLDFRGNVLKRPRTPFYSLKMGYGFMFPSGDDNFNNVVEAKGGFLFHPALGMRFDSRTGTSFVFDFGYQFQNATITSQRWNGVNIDDVQYRRFTFRLGWVF